MDIDELKGTELSIITHLCGEAELTSTVVLKARMRQTKRSKVGREEQSQIKVAVAPLFNLTIFNIDFPTLLLVVGNNIASIFKS